MEDGFKVKEYHFDIGIFSSTEYKEHCMRQHQKYSFSGIGAKHQNGIAERNIKSVAQLGMHQHASRRNTLAPTCQLEILAAGD
jgi:hypothetical protein